MRAGLRRLVKTGVAAGAHWSRLDRWVGSRRGLDQAPLVLGYHRVVGDFERSAKHTMPSMLVSIRTLERHLDWVGERFRFVSLDEWAAVRSGAADGLESAPGEPPLAVVTFDDGYRDVYENAFPLLERKGIPFAVFVVSDLVGTDRLLLHDELFLRLAALFNLGARERDEGWRTVCEAFQGEAASAGALLHRARTGADAYRALRLLLHGLDAGGLRRLLDALRSVVAEDEAWHRDHETMTWEMLRDLHDAGVTIGSHTRSHALLASQPEGVVREELEGSRRALETGLGAPVRHLAYPDGSYNGATVRMAHAAGYTTACAICSHGDERHPSLAIPRRFLWEGTCRDVFGRFSPSMLSCQVNGVFDGKEQCRHDH